MAVGIERHEGVAEIHVGRHLGDPEAAARPVLVHVGDGARVYERLLRQGVIVRPVANYGLPAHIRVTVGLPEENRRFLTALESALAL